LQTVLILYQLRTDINTKEVLIETTALCFSVPATQAMMVWKKLIWKRCQCVPSMHLWIYSTLKRD